MNNKVYLDWFLAAAMDHSSAQGWPHTRYIEQGAGWVVRRHEIDYLAPAVNADELLLRTWVSTLSASTSDRRYELTRKSDGKKVAAGKTTWVWIDFRTGRPARVPAEVERCFEVAE